MLLISRNFIQLVLSSETSGRVLKYDPKTKETTVLVRNLQFPNGVSLGKDGSFFVFCEGSIGRFVYFHPSFVCFNLVIPKVSLPCKY